MLLETPGERGENDKEGEGAESSQLPTEHAQQELR